VGVPWDFVVLVGISLLAIPLLVVHAMRRRLPLYRKIATWIIIGLLLVVLYNLLVTPLQLPRL
jgi:hypothetical protein